MDIRFEFSMIRLVGIHIIYVQIGVDYPDTNLPNRPGSAVIVSDFDETW